MAGLDLGEGVVYKKYLILLFIDLSSSSSQSILSLIRVDLINGQTLFHELGHTLHTLLSETQYQHLSGNRGGTDFAEFSSHLFELFYTFGIKEMINIEGLSNDSIDIAKLQLYKFQAIDISRMILSAYLDQVFYDENLNKNDWINIEINQQYNKIINILNLNYGNHNIQNLLAPPALTNFEHLIHYGGTYFCYIYSRYNNKLILKKSYPNQFLSST